MASCKKIFDDEVTLIASDGATYINYVEESCTVTAFGHSSSPTWDVFYRPYQSKKLTRVGLPLMFPNFSSVANDTFEECGTHLPKHGIFCREFHDSKMRWSKASGTENSVTLTASWNEDSLKMYPFKFRCDATFEVKPKTLVHSLKITNLETEKTLPASPGIHPYFTCKQADKKNVELSGSCNFKCSSYDWIQHCPDDNLAFGGELTIKIPNQGTVRITDKSKYYKRMQIWSDKSSAEDHEFVCFEPVVLGANGLNNKSERLNIAPGQSVTLQCEFEMLE